MYREYWMNSIFCSLYVTMFTSHFLLLQVATASRWPQRRVPDHWPWVRWELGCVRTMTPSKGMTSLSRWGQVMMSAMTSAHWWCLFRSWLLWSSSAWSRPHVLATGASAWCPAHILHLLPCEVTLRKALWEKDYSCGHLLRMVVMFHLLRSMICCGRKDSCTEMFDGSFKKDGDLFSKLMLIVILLWSFL